ncbi:AraC family transcriptional regulator [Paenibacillus antarcticus]|uniref:AraC family transcriptional regulator n=1 Tax=Paenibacillus antarcticus TaxID=253703 RepID=A0A168QLP2_9BACL|nr:AraC family transcriptional regulator [Paenibacillus antarcticus]OAB47932.1 AraC family transcriptional regulator [Paenibacillus antarcticus]
MAIFQFNPFRPSESSRNLHLLFWGKEDCAPGHTVGPGVRDVYKIHFIHKGKGSVRVGTDTHTLVAGQAFLIIPNVVYYYEADHDEPWTYSWVGFEGTDVLEILSRTLVSPTSPIFPMDNRVMPTLYDQLTSVDLASGAVDLRLQAILYDFMASWVEVTSDSSVPILMSGRQEAYVHQTLEFLHTHYSEDISLESHADSLGLDRKHLSTIFKKALDVPPRLYLLHYRMNKACELLAMREFTIGEVARSVGYHDPLLFSRMFKKVIGVSPKKYQNNIHKSDINP